MATLARQFIDTDGLSPQYDAAGGSGDKALPGDSVFLHVKNGSGASINVILVTPGTVDGLAIGDRTVAVAAGGSEMIALDPKLYADKADTGLARWTYSANTTVTVGVFAR